MVRRRRTAYTMPARESAVADRVVTGVAGRAIPKQDIGRTIAVVVPDADDRVGSGGTADIVPTLQGATAVHLVEAGVAGGIVAEQDVGDAVAVEVANPDHVVGGRGTADIVPTLQGAIAVHLVEAGVAGGIVAEQ